MTQDPIRSMTGFGRAQTESPVGLFLIEMRSVNNRFADITLNLPRELANLEQRLRALIQQLVKRGKVDCRVRYTPGDAQQPAVLLNRALAGQYLAQLRALQAMGAEGEASLSVLAAMPGVFESRPAELNEDALCEHLTNAITQAAASLNEDRQREGQSIATHLRELEDELRECVAQADQLRGQVVEKFRERFTQRIEELLKGAKLQADPGRLEQEIALFADRADISEEIVRLGAHLERLDQLLCNPGEESVGKNLDFLMQEFNREVNTLCSKARDTGLTGVGLTMKAIVEKMREQVQNVE